MHTWKLRWLFHEISQFWHLDTARSSWKWHVKDNSAIFQEQNCKKIDFLSENSNFLMSNQHSHLVSNRIFVYFRCLSEFTRLGIYALGLESSLVCTPKRDALSWLGNNKHSSLSWKQHLLGFNKVHNRPLFYLMIYILFHRYKTQLPEVGRRVTIA